MKDEFDHKLIESTPFYNSSPNLECSNRMEHYHKSQPRKTQSSLTPFVCLPREAQRQEM